MRTMSRDGWLSLYRGFRCIGWTCPDRTCQHTAATATETPPRKDGAFDVRTTCSCGMTETWTLVGDRRQPTILLPTPLAA